MTAYKIHSAVVEQSVASRDFYREVVIGYAVLYLLSFIVFVFIVATQPFVSLGKAPIFIIYISDGLMFVLLISLFLAYLMSFIQMKKALNNTSYNAVDIKLHIFFLVLILISSAI